MPSTPSRSTRALVTTEPRGRTRFWLGLGTLAAALLILQAFHPQEALRPLLERAREAGWLGPALLGLGYVPAALAGVPLALLTFTAGWLFGPVTGFLIGLPACTAASCVSFALGRALSGDPRLLARGQGRVAALARGLGTRRGFWAIVALRLVPVTPFSVLNFAFGATPISLRSYALATVLGSIPACLAFALAGAWFGGVR